MEILIFKTDISTRMKLRLLASALKNIPAIHRWSVDTEDTDKVLRVEARDTITESYIMMQAYAKGIQCEPLPD